jgi:hypothetical protein
MLSRAGVETQSNSSWRFVDCIGATIDLKPGPSENSSEHAVWFAYSAYCGGFKIVLIYLYADYASGRGAGEQHEQRFCPVILQLEGRKACPMQAPELAAGADAGLEYPGATA